MSDPVIFIQVGSNEGVMSTDPLSALILKEQWQGIFQKIKPKIILFEHVNMEFDTYFTCQHYLQSHGYTVIHTGDIDTVVGNPWT